MSRFTTTAPTRASIAIAFSTILLAACGTYGPGKLAPGQSEADARRELGEPTTRALLPGGGTRLDYARGPFGKHTYRVELDASGKVTAVSQLLTELNFEALRPGWTADQVTDRIGPPSEARGGWRGLGTVWAYRFDEPFRCRWFQVWVVEGRVRDTGYAPDPLCEERRSLFPG